MADLTLFQLIEDNAGLVGLAGGLGGAVLGAVLGVFLAKFQTHGLAAQVAEPASRPFLIEKYTETRAHGYYRQIGRLLALSRRIYGERLLGGAAMGRCLQIAYLYPLVALLIGWVIWNAGTLGGLPVLPDGMAWEDRAWRAAVLVLIGGVEFAIFRFLYTIPERVEQALTPMRKKLDQRAGFLAKAARWSVAAAPSVAFAVALAVAVTVAGAFALALAVAGAFAVAGAVALAGAFALAVAGAVAFAVAYAVAYAVALAGALAFAFAFAFAENPEAASLFIFFFSVFPFFNALADFFSVAATRRFIGDLHSRSPGFGRIFLDLCLDFGIAALCLAGLLACLWATLEVWAALAPQSLAFDWRAYRDAILAGDIGQASILILMVLTTLIPTFLHLLVGLAGFWMAESQGWKRAVADLKDWGQRDIPRTPQNAIIADIRVGIFWGWFKGGIAATLTTLALFYGITAFLAWLPTLLT